MASDLKPCRYSNDGEGDFCLEHQSRERLVRAEFCEEVYWNMRHLWEKRRAEPKTSKLISILEKMDCDCAGEGVSELGGCYRCLALDEVKRWTANG